MIYKSLFDEEGNEVTSRKILFVTADEYGAITSSTSSQSLAVNRTGFVYVVDDAVIDNIEKFEVINGVLQLKGGETIEEPKKSEEEKQEEELLRQLAELRARRKEESTEGE